MDNHDYVYRETAEERAAMPEVTLSKWEKMEEWIKNHKAVIIITIIALFAAYTFFIGGGRYIGTWQTQSGRYTYELKLSPFGFGEMSVSRNGKEQESASLHWEYDDSTGCIIIVADGKEGERVILYKVMGLQDDALTLSQDGGSEKVEVFTRK